MKGAVGPAQPGLDNPLQSRLAYKLFHAEISGCSPSLELLLTYLVRRYGAILGTCDPRNSAPIVETVVPRILRPLL